MDKKKTLKSIFKVSASNILSLLAGVLVGFLLPKIIGVTDYGYYKTFTLYCSYVGLFHFGIEDGIYLAYGGKNYEELERTKFRFYSRFLLVLEFSLSAILALVSAFSLSGEPRFIFICVAIYLFSCNIINYYQLISQVTYRFTELSSVIVIKSALTAFAIIVLWVLHHFFNTLFDYKLYTLIFITINVLITIWYMVRYRDITFGKAASFLSEKNSIWLFLKIGFPLMIANLCSSLILTIDRQFVNILFDTDTFAIYAFAYNLLALITTATSAISTVIYPTMKRANPDTLNQKYTDFISLILMFVFGCVAVYFPLCLFVNWFLPKYVDSLPIFQVILPGLAISATITIVMQNYYKTLNKNLSFFLKSLVVLVLSAAGDVVAYYWFKTPIAISAASIIVMLVWYVIIDSFFVKRHCKVIKNFCYLLVMMGIFYLVSYLISNAWLGLLAYIIAFVGISLLFFHQKIFAYIKSRRIKKNA